MTDEQEDNREGENTLQIADVLLISSELSINDLCGYMIWLLDQPQVKNYLDIVKNNKKIKNLGIG